MTLAERANESDDIMAAVRTQLEASEDVNPRIHLDSRLIPTLGSGTALATSLPPNLEILPLSEIKG